MITPETPIMIMNDNNFINFTKIKNIGNGFWKNHNHYVQYNNCYFKVWDGKCWTEIKSIIKHKPNKKFYKVSTTTGFVIMSEDNISKGDFLVDCYPSIKESKFDISKIMDIVPKTKSARYAFALGVFFSCNIKNDTCVFNVVSKNKKMLNFCKSIFEQEHSRLETTFKIVSFEKNKWSLQPENNIEYISKKYNRLCYDKDFKFKKIPRNIFKNKNLYKHFICGVYQPNKKFVSEGEIGAAGLFFILRNIGILCNVVEYKNNNFILEHQMNPCQECKNVSVTLYKGKVPKYVYTIETESGKFQAGIGTTFVKTNS